MIQIDGHFISLDKREKGSDIDFISHAHSDHISAARSSKRILASRITSELLQEMKGIEKQEEHDIPKGIKLINAGHVLGSRQLAVNDEKNGRKVVYTGDYQMQKSRTCEAIEIEEADTVIVDSTYYNKDVEFDERKDVEESIRYWTDLKLHDGIVLFGAYALGKAQELISILNESGVFPIVSKKISKVNKVYKRNGIRLDYTSAYEGNDDYQLVLRGNFVGIVENSLLNTMAVALSELYNKRVFTAVATGFAKMMKFNTDVQFPLSDHADFRQCMDYINETGARKVLTYGPNRLALAGNLAEKGYNAAPY